MLPRHNTDVRTTTGPAPGPGGPDWRWDALQARDGSAAGRFVYGVTSTGVFCRPGCPSRRPRRDRVRFFDTPAAAAAAGFRACRRCDPAGSTSSDDAIARASSYLTRHADETVPLARLARVAGLSPFHLQRRFKHALGLSPREYQAACRAERFRRELRSGRDVAGATYEAGYGSPSRVYDAAPTGRGMPPATYRRGGAGAEIGFVTLRCPLGWLLIAATRGGLCAVKLGDSSRALEAELRRELPQADIRATQGVPAAWVRAVVTRVSGSASAATLPLDVRATAFQWRVWRALQAIAPGDTRSYSELAAAIGQPSAVRAVARACATNPVCLVVPCHRVIGKDGGLGGYRWGVDRKARLLESEHAPSRPRRVRRRRQAK